MVLVPICKKPKKLENFPFFYLMKKNITKDWKFQLNRNDFFGHTKSSNYITYHKIQILKSHWTKQIKIILEKNDIAHLQLHKWFLLLTQKKFKWYCTLVNLQAVFLIHIGEEKNWYLTLVKLQVSFSTLTRKYKKWYYTLASPQVVFFIHIGEKKWCYTFVHL